MTDGLFSTPRPMRIARSDLNRRMEVEVSLAKAEAAEARVNDIDVYVRLWT